MAARAFLAADFPRLIILLAAGFWLAVLAFLAPRFGGVDVFHFKDAACNLVQGYGFETASVVLSESFERRLYTSHVPLYPLAYAAYAFLFGCGGYANAAFELALGLVLSGLVFWGIVQTCASTGARTVLALLCAAALPLGCLAPANDRYEILAMICHATLLLVRWQVLFAGRAGFADFLICGIVFLIHPYLGCLIAGIVGILLLNRSDSFSPRNLVALLPRAVLAGVAFLIPIAIWIVAFEIVERGSFDRFFGHAFGTVTNASATYASGLIHALTSAGIVSALTMAQYFVVAPAGIVAAWSLRRRPGKAASLALLFALAAPWVFPKQNLYFAASAFVVLLMIHLLAAPGPKLRFAALALFLAMLAPTSAIELVQRWHASATFAAERDRAAAFVAHIDRVRPQGPILVPGTHFFLFKPISNRIFEPHYLRPGHHDLRQVAGEISCYTLSATSAPPPTILSSAELEPWAVQRSGHFIEFLGVRLFSKQWVWTCDYYVARR
jgi:hypothetical protein